MADRFRIRKAVLPAAGLGTRFLPLTKAQPKEMLPIVDKPMIQYVVEEAVAAGIEDLLIVTGRGKRSIEDHFDKAYELEHHLKEQHKSAALQDLDRLLDSVSIHYTRQREPLGLGHAIGCARHHVGSEPFAVMLGDDVFVSHTPVIGQVMSQYAARKASVMSMQQVARSVVTRYGILDGELDGSGAFNIRHIVEKPPIQAAPSLWATYGRYVFAPELFDCLLNTEPGKNGEIQLSDGVNLLLESQRVLGVAFEGRRYDAGDKMGLIAANVEFALNRPDLRDAMRAYLHALSKDDFKTG